MSIKVEGLADLERALSQLKKSTAKGVLRRIAKAALEPVREEAARLAPEDSGLLEDRVIVSNRKVTGGRKLNREGRHDIQLYMGPANGAASIRGQMQEFGTFKEPAQPFMRPAWDRGRDGVLRHVAEDWGGEVMKTAQRAAKRAARRK